MADPSEPVVVADSKHIQLVRREGWEYVRRKNVTGIVGVVAVSDEGKMILVEQYRPPVGKRVIEIPAGLAGDTADVPMEELAEAARRELLEETGYAAGEMEMVAEGAASAGITDEIITIFRARGVTKTGKGGGDGSEEIEVHEVPVAEVAEWIERRKKQGREVDLKVYVGLYFAGKP